MDITIIADDGGGLTLQLIDPDGNRYQHYYDGEDSDRLCDDIVAAQEDNHFRRWEGNEAEDEDGNSQWLDPTYEDICNGGYRVVDVEYLNTIDPDEAWGRALSDLVREWQSR